MCMQAEPVESRRQCVPVAVLQPPAGQKPTSPKNSRRTPGMTYGQGARQQD